MKFLKDWFEKLVLKSVIGKVTGKVALFLNGKKTYTGLVTLLLWVFIYVIPVILPQFGYVSELAKQVKDALEQAGVNLDSELLVSGASLTVTGLLHKIWKYFTKE